MIGKNLKYYRQIAGLSQDKLAGIVGLSKMTISNYENNKRDADSDTVIKLADALNIKASALLINPTGSARITHAEFRKKSGMSLSSIDMVYEKVDRYLGRFHTILRVLGDAVLPTVPAIDKLPFTDIDESASRMREYLSLSPTGPVGNIIDTLENCGIIVCQIDIEDDHFSGINGTLNGRPYIAVNKSMTLERQRFTLIHELTHILFAFPANINEEKTVDGITGAFLFPKDDVIRELGYYRTNVRGELSALQREYGISMQSALIRAKQAGCITGSIYEEHQKWISKNGFIKKGISGEYIEYGDHIEHSTLFEKLVVRAVSENMINISKASELLELPHDSVRHLCGLDTHLCGLDTAETDTTDNMEE